MYFFLTAWRCLSTNTETCSKQSGNRNIVLTGGFYFLVAVQNVVTRELYSSGLSLIVNETHSPFHTVSKYSPFHTVSKYSRFHTVSKYSRFHTVSRYSFTSPYSFQIFTFPHNFQIIHLSIQFPNIHLSTQFPDIHLSIQFPDIHLFLDTFPGGKRKKRRNTKETKQFINSLVTKIAQNNWTCLSERQMTSASLTKDTTRSYGDVHTHYYDSSR
jgi:hypothetical protein